MKYVAFVVGAVFAGAAVAAFAVGFPLFIQLMTELGGQ